MMIWMSRNLILVEHGDPLETFVFARGKVYEVPDYWAWSLINQDCGYEYIKVGGFLK